jgi:hypothetical protein
MTTTRTRPLPVFTGSAARTALTQRYGLPIAWPDPTTPLHHNISGLFGPDCPLRFFDDDTGSAVAEWRREGGGA